MCAGYIFIQKEPVGLFVNYNDKTTTTQAVLNNPFLSVNEQVYLDNMEWTRSVHGDVNDNPDGNHKQSIPSKTFLNNCNSPLAGLFQILPHSFWEHIARCTEKKRESIFNSKSVQQEANATIRDGSRHQSKSIGLWCTLDYYY